MTTQQQAWLAIHRRSPQIGCLRRISVWVDERKVGTLYYTWRRRFAVAPGEHTVHVKMGKDASSRITVRVPRSETLELVIDGAFRASAIMFWPLHRGPQVDLSLQVADVDDLEAQESDRHSGRPGMEG